MTYNNLSASAEAAAARASAATETTAAHTAAAEAGISEAGVVACTEVGIIVGIVGLLALAETTV